MKPVNKYNTAVKTIKKFSPIPIKLHLKGKEFDGFWFKQNLYINRDDYGDSIILIKRDESDFEFFDGSFVGKYCDIHNAVYGKEFTFMTISENVKQVDLRCADYSGWTKKSWEEYINKKNNNPDFTIEIKY